MVATTIQLIERQTELTPNKIAITFKGTDLTYVELNILANKLASYLVSIGVGKGNIVGIAMDRSVELIVSLLAIFKAGAAYLPLDPDYPNQRLEYMLGDSKAALLFTSLKFKGELNVNTKVVYQEEIWPFLENYSFHHSIEVLENDLAYLLYTSGTTGHPKGVMVEHKNLLNLILSVQSFPGLESKDRLLSLTTMSFDISVLEFFLPLTVGARLYIADTDLAKDGEAILDLITKENISFMQATPSTYKMMLAAEWENRCNIKLICCGEQLPRDLAQKILSKCARLFNMYGPTETTIYSTGKEILKEDLLITIGKPILNTKVYILNEQQEIVKDGEIGEICIAGEGLARGYFEKPELTSEKFIMLLEEGVEIRLYRTGDLGKILSDGEIQCFGRVDHQIKIRGYRIETGEIEYTLLQEDNIKEAIVTSWPGPVGDGRIAAYVVIDKLIPSNKISLTIKNWKRSLKSSLPFYMVPNDFIIIDKFPLLENGKINRKALPNPSINILQVAKDTVPRNSLEILIAKVWADNLGIENIGIFDNFFDLGGHSLAAVKVIVQIKKASGKYLPLGSLLKHPTIAKLAVVLENETNKNGFESLVPLKAYGNKAPLYMIHGLGSTVFKFYDLAHHLDPEQPVFGIQARGVESTELAAESIEEMASQYISEILKNDPIGPYHLSGYSLGGLIAFEMIQQLERMGKKVGLLIMFDTFIVKNDQLNPGLYKKIHKVAARTAKFIYTFGLLLSEPRRTIDHKIFMLKQTYKRMFGLKLENDNRLDNDFDQLNILNKLHERAEVNYKLSYHPIQLHLFKAKNASRYMNDFKYLGWKPYVKDIVIHLVEGDHITMFDDLYIHGFADKLQKVLDDFNKRLP